MNKLEERHKEAIIRGGFSSAHPYMGAIKCAAITKEIAIGFNKWKFENFWFAHHLGIDDGLIFEHKLDWTISKTDSELFEMYLNTLK